MTEKENQTKTRAWLYERQINDYIGTQKQLDYLQFRAEKDGCFVVGSSYDTSKGIIHRVGYRKMVRQMKAGKMDVIYISCVGSISHNDSALTHFFKTARRYGVPVRATDDHIAYQAMWYRFGHRVHRFATQKKMQVPW